MHPVESLAIEIYLRRLNSNQLSDGPYRDEDMEIDENGGFIRITGPLYPDGYNYSYWEGPGTATRRVNFAEWTGPVYTNNQMAEQIEDLYRPDTPPPEPPPPVTRYRLTSSLAFRFVRNCVNEAKELLREVAIQCDGLDKNV